MKRYNNDQSFIPTEFEDKALTEEITEIKPMVYKDYREIEINEEELENIEKLINDAEGDICKSIQEIKSNSVGFCFPIASSILFIFLCVLLSGISTISGLNSQAENLFENSEWKVDSYLTDIKTVEDLDTYIRNIYLSTIYSINNDSFTTIFIGSRLTLNLYEQIKNNMSEYNKVINITFNDKIGGLYGKKFIQEDMGLWSYHENLGFKDRGGFVSYFLDSYRNNSLDHFRKLKPIWFAPNFATLEIETLFHNRHLKTTLLYTIEFEKAPSGYIYVKTSSTGTFYEEYETKSLKFVAIMVIIFIYTVFLIFQIFNISQSLIKTCRTFWSNFKIDLEFFELIEIVNVIMTFSTVTLTINIIFSNIGKISLPLGTGEIDSMISIARTLVVITRVNSITCVLMVIKITLALKNKFPSFGVLFDTIWKSKNDLINFSFITLILLFGFVFMGILAFGIRYNMFNSIQGALNALFIMILSNVGYSDLVLANSDLALIFTVVYCTLFYTILLNMFIAIVISTYIEIKSQSQLMLEAKAKIVGEEAKKIIMNIYNLLFFRAKNNLVDECVLYHSLCTVDKSEQSEDVIEKVKQLEASIMQQIDKNYYAIFKFNLGQFGSKMESGSLKTNEQVKAEITNALREIFITKKKRKLFKQMQQNDVHYNYSLIIGMFIFLVFTVLLLITTLSRMRISEKNSLSEIATNLIDPDKLEGIVNENDIYDYMENHLFNALTTTTTYSFNYFFSDPVARITINKFKIEDNRSDFSKNAIPQYIDESLKLIKKNVRGVGTGLLYEYRPAGDQSTYIQKGGYVSYLYSTTNKNQFFFTARQDRVAGKTTDSIAIEWLMYNSNVEIFSYCALVFKNEPSGLITNKFIYRPVDLEIFSRHYLYIGILEVIWGCLNLYFIFLDLKALLTYWRKHQEIRLQKLAGEKIVMEITKILSDKKKTIGCVKMFKTCITATLHFLRRCFEFLIQLFKVLIEFLTSGIFVFINTLSNILSILLLAQVLKLYTNEFAKNYSIEDVYPELIGEMFGVSQIYEDYRLYAAFLTFITFIRILQFYNFSNDLSILTDVLDSAKFDIFFFIAMFLIIHIGYSVMAYLILGTSIYEFSTVARSLLSCYLILLGSFDLDSIQVADPILGMIFFGTFIVVFYLLLLNMFTAIIGAHHSILEQEDEGFPNVGFFEKIYITLRDAKCPKKKNPIQNARIIQKLNPEFIFEENEIPQDIQIQQIDYPVSTKFFEGCDAWYNLLEQTMKKVTSKKIVLSNFNLVKGRKSEIFKYKPISEIALISAEQWVSESLDGKIDIWRTLSSVQYKNNIMIKGNAIMAQEQTQPIMNISSMLIKLWKITDMKDKVSMWAGRNHFTDYERICIWNSLPFSQSYYPNEKLPVLKDQEWDSDAENEVWLSLTLQEKLEVVQKIVEPLKVFNNKLKKGLHVTEEFLIGENIKKLNFKELLWVALSHKTIWKFSLYMNNDDAVQAEIIAFLIFYELQNNVFQLEHVDTSMWEQLNCCIHDKLYAHCIFNAEKVKMKLVEEKHNEVVRDIECLKLYHSGIKADVEQYKRTKTYLNNQNEILRKRMENSKRLKNKGKFK